jgi:UDP-glucose 4-epimerase
MLLNSDFTDPINIGSAEMVSINQLVDIAEEIAGVKLKRSYNLGAPKGVNGRSSDNTLIKQVFNWEPSTCACAMAWRSPTSGSTTRSKTGRSPSEIEKVTKLARRAGLISGLFCFN